MAKELKMYGKVPMDDWAEKLTKVHRDFSDEVSPARYRFSQRLMRETIDTSLPRVIVVFGQRNRQDCYNSRQLRRIVVQSIRISIR